MAERTELTNTGSMAMSLTIGKGTPVGGADGTNGVTGVARALNPDRTDPRGMLPFSPRDIVPLKPRRIRSIGLSGGGGLLFGAIAVLGFLGAWIGWRSYTSETDAADSSQSLLTEVTDYAGRVYDAALTGEVGTILETLGSFSGGASDESSVDSDLGGLGVGGADDQANAGGQGPAPADGQVREIVTQDPVSPEAADAGEEFAKSPYWNLPLVAPPGVRLKRRMSPGERETWLAEIDHPFLYQHYLAVEDIRRRVPEDGEEMLYKLSDQRRLWLRMQALAALIERGSKVPLENIARAIGTTRAGLLRRYFERFSANNTATDRYLMRASLRFAPADARLIVLRILTNEKNDSLRGPTLVAASFDKAPAIRRWAERQLRANPLPLKDYMDYVEVAKGIRALEVKAPTDAANPSTAALGDSAPAGDGDYSDLPQEQESGPKIRTDIEFYNKPSMTH